MFFSEEIKADGLPIDVPKVNILTWWGYLDKPWVPAYIRKKCNVDISFDEYYTNDEFQNRWKNQKYDIIIFEDTFYEVMKGEIKDKGHDMSSVVNDYNPIIKKQFLSRHYEKNVLYFFQSTTGVLWNPNLIHPENFANVDEIFKSAANHGIVILDDPQTILTVFGNKNSQDPYRNFYNLVKDKKIYIGNDFGKILESQDFSFSYVWSGDAIFYVNNSHKAYQFLIRPDISYISSDLITQLANNSESTCVMKTLSSKEFLTKLQHDTYYFSPYGSIGTVKSKQYRDIYDQYLKNLSRLKWINAVSEENYEKEYNEWKLIKLKIKDNE